MVIPSHALSKVVGKGGTNLANIRNVSFRAHGVLISLLCAWRTFTISYLTLHLQAQILLYARLIIFNLV